MKGKTILHYAIRERLGAGGMGEVYLAEDTKLGRLVAIKFLPASYQYDPGRRERFLREAQAASSLRSPNIAAIYDIGDSEGTMFIAMEYVEGDALSIRIKTGPLPARETAEIAMQVADALDEAHSNGIVHRDIKSSNLIITRRGLVKLIDFGLARITESSQSPAEKTGTLELGQQTAAGVVLGTVSYMSPEQALGRTTDHRTDIFSLGIVIYEALVGSLPFKAESVTEVIDSIVHREPPAIARLNYDVPPDLERIVRKCLEKDPEFRYQKARDLYIDLSNLLRDLGTGERPSAASYHLPPESAATALNQGASSAAAAHLENAVAVMTFSNITEESEDDWIGAGIAETVTADLKSIRGLPVIGRERVFEALKNLSLDYRGDIDEQFGTDIGRYLGADWVIAGGYQRMGELIRITARVINVEAGTLFRAVKIDGAIGEIFSLQDKIVNELSQGLKLKVNTSDLAQMGLNKSESVEAYEYHSRGMINIRMGSLDSLDRAIHFFEKATELDPNYAGAWAALGGAYDLKGSFLSIPDLSSRAVEFEHKAIILSPRLSDAHVWLGSALTSLGRFDEAIDSIKEGLRLDSNNDLAYLALARAYWIGKGMIDAGITELERAAVINAHSGYAYLQLSLLYFIKGDHDKAEMTGRKAIEIQEGNLSGKKGRRIIGAYTRLGEAFYSQGRYAEAIREYERELEFLASSHHALRERCLIEVNQKLSAAHLRAGDREEAERCFEQAIEGFKGQQHMGVDEPFTKYHIACLYSLRDNPELALKYLSESFAQLPALTAALVHTNPDFDGIRNHWRFIELIGGSDE